VNRPAFQAFGLHLVTELDLPGEWRNPRAPAERDVEITLDQSIPHTLPGAVLEWAGIVDGGRFAMERGADGEFLFRHETGRHLLSADARRLRCAPVAERDAGWFRVLLDSVLLSVALLRGQEALHAGCVRVAGGAVAIVAASGGGKSTLVAELVGRRHELVADDITFLSTNGTGPPSALAGAPVMTVPDGAHQPPGELLTQLAGERWVSAAVTDGPTPLRAVIQLDRRPGARTMLRPGGDAPRLLLSALLPLPKTPERALARLQLASTLANRCRILTLTADPSTTPARLADLVEEASAA
jgi:hypothetical protein